MLQPEITQKIGVMSNFLEVRLLENERKAPDFRPGDQLGSGCGRLQS